MDSKGFITRYKDKNPTIHRDAFVDVSSRIIGDVNIGAGASIWPMAVLRADIECGVMYLSAGQEPPPKPIS